MSTIEPLLPDANLFRTRERTDFESGRNVLRMSIFNRIADKKFHRALVQCLFATCVPLLLTFACYRSHLNLATASLIYVIVVMLLACVGSVASSIVASITAALCLVRLAPPAHSFRISDPLDYLAVAAFLMTSLAIVTLVSRLRMVGDEALSSVNRRLIDAEQRERNRIGRELHDDINQRLALVRIGVEHAEQSLSKSLAGVTGQLREIGQCVSEISTDLQGLSHQLYCSKLEYLGIVTATRSFCRELSEKHKVEIHFESRDVPNHLSPEISLPLYRVLQEALHNAVKHSGARQFKVELFAASHAIHLIVSDSGIGFNLKAAVTGIGLGLVSMQERMKLLNGEFSIDSQLNHGTTIRAHVHLN
jgi:signal transduction histidine kinase